MESKAIYTPIGGKSNVNQGFQFPKTTFPESTPQVKLDRDDCIVSDRLKYNKDPSSMNRNNIDIDDDGNINMRVTPSPSPTPMSPINAVNEASDSSVDEARTFVSSHLLFSHLMSIDAKKNTLSQLNKSNQKN